MSHLRSLVLLLLPFSLAHAASSLDGFVPLSETPSAITDVELASWSSEIPAQGVVALGESVHGSEPFLKLQARLIRYLVENRGFRVVIWENALHRSRELQTYLSSCRSRMSVPPIDTLYMPTQADIEFFSWACAFNLAHPGDPIVFRGMDIWDRPWSHFSDLIALNAELGLGASVTLDDAKRVCPIVGADNWTATRPTFAKLNTDKQFLPAADFLTCLERLNEFDRQLRDLINRSVVSPYAKKRAYSGRLNVSTLIGWLKYYDIVRTSSANAWNERDQAQARNIKFILEQESVTKAVLIAHTSHTSHGRSDADWWGLGLGAIQSGVHYLETIQGIPVKNYALTGYEVSGTQGEFLKPTAPDSLDLYLHDQGVRAGYVPSSAAFLSRYSKWWFQNENVAGPFENGVYVTLADHFDGYFFFDTSLLGLKAEPWRDIWKP